jgi:hypothetical protein
VTQQLIESWLVSLDGHAFDLEDLPRWFTQSDIRVEQRGNGYMLVIPAAVIGQSHEAVRELAERHVELINGIGRLLNPKFAPVTLSDQLLGVDVAGAVLSTVIAVRGVEMRVKAGSVGVMINGRMQADPQEGIAAPFVRAASISPRAHDAMLIMSRPALTWSELYLLFELVEGDVGGEMYNRDWIDKPRAGLFTRTANSYSTLRSRGRHGKDKLHHPKHPMARDEAVALIRNLVSAWLGHIGK